MKIITAIAVIASIVFVGWTRNRLVKYEQSLEAVETEGLAFDDPHQEQEDFDLPVDVDIQPTLKDDRRE
eukprot:CAMPEP_0117012546 /NCGR_PEP_ID=MMETSP0472-20121206/10535_1 /TAXON_ID=693140 ORGANISM="Tiarina fusus, Strain LIS" /NCGR_SAMPLE_ID=MMETSP0472 /ASSEMBLY_ACC=CAM_ASM_000603 /LENGTH=68 /DNA_ID=CAMNT_0004715641 /DNA_START=179 /DNA_END=385 /DNA_ORIENTATION=+